MKNTLRLIGSIAGLATLLPLLSLADEAAPKPKPEKKELRMLAAPGARNHVFVRRGEPAEKETVTFLGVITTPVSETLSAQLGLPPGSGLVVTHLEENGPAAASLKEHDILLKFDDQLLVDQHQLSVLIRQHKDGDEVTLTYVRTGKQATARVKLGQHEVPKMSAIFTRPVTPDGAGFAWAQGGEGKLDVVIPRGVPAEREDVDRVLDLIESHHGEPMRIRIEDGNGPGFRAMRVNTANSNLVYSDDHGSLELTVQDEKKSLVAKNARGEEVFSGPINTPGERDALPADVRERLEKLEGMQGVAFRTDGDFRGAETRVITPQPRGIALPRRSPPDAVPVRPPIFF